MTNGERSGMDPEDPGYDGEYIEDEASVDTQIMKYDPHLLEKLEVTHLAAKKAIEMIDDLVKTSLRMTKSRHWYDYEGKPYLKESGVMIVKRGLPVEIEPLGEVKWETFDDDRGPYYVGSRDFKASWTNGMFGSVTVTGTASSRDALVGRKGGEDVPIQEIDRTKVMRKLDTNGRRRALMRLLGVDDISWKEFEELTGVKRDELEKVSYAGAGADKTEGWSEEQKDKGEKMRAWILEMHGNNAQTAQQYLEDLTTWTPRGKSEPVKGKRTVKALTGKQIDIHFKKVKNDFDSFQRGQDRGGKETGERKDLFD